MNPRFISRRYLAVPLIVGVLLVLVAGAAILKAANLAGRPRGLASPFDIKAIRAQAGRSETAPFSCPPPPPPVHDLKFETKYKSDKENSWSVIDDEKYAAYMKAYKPFGDFEKALPVLVNRYVASDPPRHDLAVCAAGWLDDWAAARAMRGTTTLHGRFVRNWILAMAASSWLEIRDDPRIPPEQKARIIDWLHHLALKTRHDFSAPLTPKLYLHNNIIFWSAWAVATVAAATDDPDLFKWSVGITRAGIGLIQADGTLPPELGRAKRAYNYHLFAALPLFMTAEMAARNGIDLFTVDGQALRRLGRLNLANLGNGADFRRATGQEQKLDCVGTAFDLGWLEIYARHYNDDLAGPALARFRPFMAYQAGGNATLLYAPGALGRQAPLGRPPQVSCTP